MRSNAGGALFGMPGTFDKKHLIFGKIRRRPLLPYDGSRKLENHADQIAARNAQLNFDRSAFANQGNKSVAVAQQWNARLVQTGSCQAGVIVNVINCMRTK